MVLDTSAIVAAIAKEPDFIRFQNAMLHATSLEMSAVTVPESRIVLHSRYGTEPSRHLMKCWSMRAL